MSTFLERRQRVTDTAGMLLFMDISAPSFSGPMRVVNDTQDRVSRGITYVGIPFGFKLPDDVAGQTPRAQLVMANVGTGITSELERLQPGELVLARLMVSDRANPDAWAQTLYLPMTQVSVSGTQATAQCGVDFLMRQQAVKLRANPFTLPGIFQ